MQRLFGVWWSGNCKPFVTAQCTMQTSSCVPVWAGTSSHRRPRQLLTNAVTTENGMWLETSRFLGTDRTSRADTACPQSQLASTRDWAEVSWAPDCLLSLSFATAMTECRAHKGQTSPPWLVTLLHGFQSCGSCFPKRAPAIPNQRSDRKQASLPSFPPPRKPQLNCSPDCLLQGHRVEASGSGQRLRVSSSD